ncbi:SMAD/FHA domain-containing protein, partial [Nadsonia fulvescens var. elongata DSM 6958]
FSIRLTPFLDHSSTAPALYFEPVVRRAPNGVVIKVGRYSDKDEDGQRPKDQASIVFRSKVVSRAHAELLITNNKWYIRDVKSSSGTFLNHVRLSPANMASASFAIRDGDVLQLGMDFRGGEEQYYKSVKVRIEINRSWQRRANKFNVSAMSKLKDLTGVGFPTNKSNDNSQECSICLVPIAPCQALFIAPCSHVWHYKCCRLLIIKAYPQFECPNCRAICDLEEDIEDS